MVLYRRLRRACRGAIAPPGLLARIGLLGLAALVGCSGGDDIDLSKDELRDPAACKACHPQQFEQWSGSMHAYAAEDPVFRAMNRRGQRETKGALGDFCIKCHAPLAVQLGLTKDGLDLDDVPAKLRGVTCYFCHTVSAVDGSHNNQLRTADDRFMRGGIADPLSTSAHGTAYSGLHDGQRLDSSRMCGGCHDVVTPAGVHLERTFAEWSRSLFALQEVVSRLTCNECHMGTQRAPVDGQTRTIHDHSVPGVDIAITPFPRIAEQRAAIQRSLATTLAAQLCVQPTAGGGAKIVATLENVGAGHSFPSGAAHDRRVWVEVIAYAGSRVVMRSGAVADGEPLATYVAKNGGTWTFGDSVFDADGKPAHMFWDVRSVSSSLLPAPLPGRARDHLGRTYTASEMPTRVTMRVRIRPIGLDVIDDLVDSGDLDSKHRAALPTFTLRATELEWTDRLGRVCVPGV